MRASFIDPVQLSASRLRSHQIRGSMAVAWLRAVYLFITIMLVALSHPQLRAQQVTTQAPAAPNLPDAPGNTSVQASFPDAVPLPSTAQSERVTTHSDILTRDGSSIALDGSVVLTYGDRTLRADHVDYNSDTADANASGHLEVTGGPNNERILASHGTLNLREQTGEFFDVTGSVGLKQSKSHLVYANGNPFLFTGRRVVKRGPQTYDIYDGTITSCTLPDPHWQLTSDHFSVANGKASGKNSVFHLLNVPILYLPYVSHATNAESRQSGLMLPVLGNSSTKGIVLGEEFYLVVNRSTDLTVGLQFFSLRGWLQDATLHYKGRSDDFILARYTGLQDRGILIGGQVLNQGGQDATFSGRHDFTPPNPGTQTRIGADVEYLSSYTFREAFTENFNQAVSTDILSTAYAEHETHGLLFAASADRYQGLKRIATPTTPEAQVRIFHVPSLEFASSDHTLGNTHLEWNLDTTAAGLKRTEPKFSSSGIVERLDLHPQLALPFGGGGWRLRPAVGVRETLYSRSRVTPYIPGTPQESTAHLNRSSVEASLDLRPPVLERTYDSGRLRKLLRHDFKHTLEPEVTYRFTGGVSNFLNVLRFDATDVVSNTNELEYGLTQHLFLRPSTPCSAASTASVDAVSSESFPDAPSATRSLTQPEASSAAAPAAPHATAPCTTHEWVSWRIAQKYFFNPTFGGAVQQDRYNILTTTLDFSGVAFLDGPRYASPVISRLRIRPTDKVDIEWNFDIDPVARKFTADNILLDYHRGNIFTGLSYARLNAPGRSYAQGVPSAVSDFSQIRILLGYGSPAQRGFGIAANSNLDLNFGQLQYGAIQSSYNWDCCGFSFEFGKYELGAVRNESYERFSFTLANIGSAGNLRRAERLF